MSNVIIGSINRVAANVRSYIQLREANEQLLSQNALLENKYLVLKRAVEFAQADTVRPRGLVVDSLHSPIEFEYCTARVVHSSISGAQNVMTIDKGSKDAVRPGCGVVSAFGVVGIVSAVSEHYASIIPLINSKLRLSCKVQHTDYFGNLSWQDPRSNKAYLTDLPRHASFVPGDTILTSGFSTIFPPNMFVGVSAGKKGAKAFTNVNKVPVRLGTDFARLHYVYVIVQSDYVPKPSDLPSLPLSLAESNGERASLEMLIQRPMPNPEQSAVERSSVEDSVLLVAPSELNGTNAREDDKRGQTQTSPLNTNTHVHTPVQ
jgi:rod shape-determining protein MreC